MNDGSLEPDRPMTAPERIGVSLRAFHNEQQAREFGDLIAYYVRVLSQHIDLSDLDGLTVAFDYAQALAELDRGYETRYKLTPSTEMVEGVAMTPAVIRDGKLKSHIVVNAAFVMALIDTKHKDFLLSLHLLAHECAHVEINKAFDTAFPEVKLRQMFETYIDAFRWQVILACWDEYAATRISATIGHDPTHGYEEVFLKFLNLTRSNANEYIRAYRVHGDLGRVVGEVYGAYGSLMKYASYLQGTMAGRGLTLDDLPATKAALAGHWFAVHWLALEEASSVLWESYGKWDSRAPFEAIGTIADAVLAEGGMVIRPTSAQQYYVDIPFTAEAMPFSAA